MSDGRDRLLDVPGLIVAAGVASVAYVLRANGADSQIPSMRPTFNRGSIVADQGVPSRDIRFPAILAIAWTLAGGLLLGGVGVALMLYFQTIPGPAVLMAASVLYLIGAGIGLAHSLVLGYFGREKGTTWGDSARALTHGLFYLIPATLVGWVVTGWVAALPLALMRSIVGSFISISAWVILLVMLYVAVSAGWEGLTRAYGGWQDRVLGTLATAGAVVSLLVLFYVGNHPVWFTTIRLSAVGKALFSIGVALWIYGPITTLGLFFLHQKLGRRDIADARLPSSRSDWRTFAVDASYVLIIGFLLAMLMLPFHAGVTGLPAVLEQHGILAGMLLSLTHAVSSELLLRLFLFTVVFWAARKYLGTDRYSVWIAIAASAITDGLFHATDVAAFGLPNAAMVVSYLLVHYVVLSAVFGYLFWKRGLATAMGAHAMSGIFLGLLAL